MYDPTIKKRITDKILLLWELNPDWRIGQLIDNVHFVATVEEGAHDLQNLSDEALEYALDQSLESTKQMRPIND